MIHAQIVSEIYCQTIARGSQMAQRMIAERRADKSK